MMPEVPIILTPIEVLPNVETPEIFEFPITKSSDVGLVVPIPILVAVSTPTVEKPETLS